MYTLTIIDLTTNQLTSELIPMAIWANGKLKTKQFKHSAAHPQVTVNVCTSSVKCQHEKTFFLCFTSLSKFDHSPTHKVNLFFYRKDLKCPMCTEKKCLALTYKPINV
jgi:hypothetical protein